MKNQTLVISLIPVKCADGVKRWFRPQIRRNINGCSDITEYHFGFGFATLRPYNASLDLGRRIRFI